MKSKLVSNAMLLLAAIIWGFSFVAQVAGSKLIGAFTMTGVRFIMAAIVLFPIIFILEKEERAMTIKASLITGTVLFCGSALQQFGIHMTSSAGIPGLITGLYMIFVPFAYFILFKTKVKGQVWIGALIALAGLVLLCYKSGEGFSFGLGELLLLLGSFFWTAHVMLIDHFGKRVRSIRFSFGQFLISGILGMICALLFEWKTISISALLEAKWMLLYIGVLSSGAGFTLQVMGQKRANPNAAVIILATESAVSAIGGFIFGIDKLTYTAVAGCVLMFGGIICSQLSPKKKRDKLLEYNTD